MSAYANPILQTRRESSPSRRARRELDARTETFRDVTLRNVGRRAFSLLAVLPTLMARRGAVRVLVIIVLLREAGGL